MTEQKENRSARRSRKMIRQAFEALLKERGFHKITVTDLVARADLNRSTFYAHYPDIYGIVDEMQEEIIQRNMELFQKIQFRNILKDPKPYLQCIAATMEQNLELMQRLDLAENIQRKSERLQEMMEYDIMHNSDIPEKVRDSSLFGIRVHFFLEGQTEGVTNHDIQPLIVDEIAEITRSVASERGYTLIDIHALTAQHPEWFEKDGVHPSNEGAAAIAREVYTVLSSK